MEKKITNYAYLPDKATLEQFKNCYEEKYVIGACLLPDAHKGYVAPIGSVFKTKNYIVPSWIGYDIGCGVSAYLFSYKSIVEKVKKNSKQIYEEIAEIVPLGQGKYNHNSNISQIAKDKFFKILKILEEKTTNE